MANGTRAGARIDVLPCAAGPGSPTSPFLARWGGDSRAAAPRKPGAPSTRGFRVLGWKPGVGFPGRNAAKRAQKPRQISLTQNESAARQKDEYQPTLIFPLGRVLLHCLDSSRSTRSILKSNTLSRNRVSLNASLKAWRYWSWPASNGRRNGPGLKLKNDGGAVLSGPSCAAAPFRPSGLNPLHLPLSRRSSSTPRAVTVSAGVNVQCPARWT
jgi:hypothetical protein